QLGRVHYYTDEKAAELIRLKPNLGIPDPRLDRGLENCDLCGNSLFREGYDESPPEPRVFIHPKIAGNVSQESPIEGLLTPMASEIIKPRGGAERSAAALAQPPTAKPSDNGRAHAGELDSEALVQAITDQVMQALNGAIQ